MTNTEIYYRKNEAFQRQQAILAGRAYRKSKYSLSQTWNGSKTNIQLIHRFQDYLFSKGTGQERVAKVTAELRPICDQLKKDLNTIIKTDAVSLIAYINTHPTWKEHTKSDYRRAIKQFYKWYEDEDPRLQADELSIRSETQKLYKYLHEVNASPKRQQIDPARMLSDDDCRRLIERGAKSILQQALIATLHVTGVRVGELLSQRISDVHERETGLWIHVNGKTGRRPVPLGYASPYITKWLNEHPLKEQANAPLWVSIEQGRYARPFKYYGVRNLLLRVKKRAGIQKPCNPHNFRHSHTTIISQKFTEAEQCILMGWKPGSRQPSNYTHLTADKVEKKYGEVYGLIPQDQRKPEMLKCQVCNEINSNSAQFCLRCGRPMNMQVLMQQQAAIEEAEHKIASLTPKEQKLFMMLLRNMAKNDTEGKK